MEAIFTFLYCYKYLETVFLIELRYEKPGFFACAKTKAQISFAVTAKLISAFVFATRKLQSLFFLNPKFQATRLLCLHSPLGVRPGRKPRRPVFSQRGSIMSDTHAVSGISLIFQKKRFPGDFSGKHRLCIASTSCTRSNITKTKQKCVFSKKYQEIDH